MFCGAKTDVGLRRKHNEDSLCTDPQLGLYAICDGIGGLSKGEVASRMALEVIQRHLLEACRDSSLPVYGRYDAIFSPRTNRLASAIRLANEAINSAARDEACHHGMGTTLVSALITDDVLSLAHVGDSRMYLIRRDTIQALTADHTLVAEQVRQGFLTEEEAARSPQKNIVTRALGVEDTVDVELNEMPLLNNDVLLLCSDGLTRGVEPDAILQVIRRETDPQIASERLVSMANEAGGEDNTTVVVVMVRQAGGQHM